MWQKRAPKCACKCAQQAKAKRRGTEGRAHARLERSDRREPKTGRRTAHRPRTQAVAGRRRGAGHIGRHAASTRQRRGRRTTEGPRAPPPTAHTRWMYPTTYGHTPTPTDGHTQGEGGAGGREGAGPPQHSRDVAGRARDEPSQRAHNEHSRPAIKGIMASHNRTPYGRRAATNATNEHSRAVGARDQCDPEPATGRAAPEGPVVPSTKTS